MFDVLASKRAVAVEAIDHFLCLALVMALLKSSDRGWPKQNLSFGDALSFGALFAAIVTGWYLWKLSVRRSEARRAIGPRFATDRQALADAMKTGELPRDPSLDRPLLVAISFSDRARREFTVPDRTGVLIIAASVAYMVWVLWWPWTLLILAISIGRWRRRSRAVVDLDELRLAAQRRQGVPPADPGGLTYADLRD
jgi:hypothetical protein